MPECGARNRTGAGGQLFQPAQPEPTLQGDTRPAFRNWAEIRDRLKAATAWAFFLDVDGTLVRLRHRPSDVRMPRAARSVLKRLAAHPHVVVTIVTGRRLADVRALVGLEGLRYFGVHGGESEQGLAILGEDSRAVLEDARRSVRLFLGGIPGIWIEDKSISIAVHYRNARAAAIETAAQNLARLAGRWEGVLHILNGSRVWEILPQEIRGKSAAVAAVLKQSGRGVSAVYIGNDGTDEVAFAALPDEITVRVGRSPRTLARFFVPTPADVLRLLERMEKELP